MIEELQFSPKAKAVCTRTIPEELIKQREGAKKRLLNYISGCTVIDMLNEAFGYMWSWNVVERFVQESQPFKNNRTNEITPQGPVAHVKGVITVPILQSDGSIIYISKTAFGSKTIIGGQSEQEHIFKAAATDALKKAASLFGIGAQLYRSEEEQIYFNTINYEDPWNEETLAKHQEDRTYIKEVMIKNNASEEDIEEIISEWSMNAYSSIQDLTPDNISDFVKYLKNIQKENEDE